MCGILGLIYRDRDRMIEESRLAAARDTLIHRGPDEAGLWVRPGVGFAHRRLSILDLKNGQQPMISGDDRFALTYNGEIYNYRDLHKQYHERGLSFDTQCDTEVLFKAVNAFGANAIHDFNGMFAFGHWDNTKRTLLLARDRLGQKPLYWYRDDQQIVFASELKALLALLNSRFDLDPVAIDQFFTRGYILSPRTIFQQIHKLPAGCMLQLDADSWQLEVKSYWDVEHAETVIDDDDAIDQLDELLTDAVRMRLISDVPIGCLLSGGIDSSLLTALACKARDEPVDAFSIGFTESEQLNELPYAEVVARHTGCRWHNKPMEAGDFAAALDDTTQYFDEPYGNFTMFSMRRLSQMARQALTVVISGQGGDELTAGYPGRYNWTQQTAAAAAIGQGRLQYATPVDDVIHHLRYSSFVPWPGGREHMLCPGLRDEIASHATPFDDIAPFWSKYDDGRRLDRVLYSDVKTNLPDYLVCLEERMTMSCSLEARNPMLDHRVVQFLLNLPQRMKIRNGQNKWILRELAFRYVPREAIDRPKRGFTPPLQLWIQQNISVLQKHFRETETTAGRLYGERWQSFLAAGQYNSQTTMPVFYSLMMAMWARHYGQHVASWTVDGGKVAGSGSIASRQKHRPMDVNIKQSPWNETYRRQTNEAVTLSRWFCQALNNFDGETKLHILGDEDGWYAHLARQCGLTVTNDESSTGWMVVGGDAMDQAIASLPSLAGGTLLLFVPFALQQQAQIQALIQKFNAAAPLAGFQTTQICPNTALFVGRVSIEPAPESLTFKQAG